MRTSNIAQHLYINALISYPRTSSQKLPPSIGYQKILKNLSKASSYQKIAFKLLAQPFLKPNEGKKIDPAHPAIYPTGNLPEKTLDAAERNVYDLIVKRFLAVFGEPAIKQSVNVRVNIKDYYFIYSGARTLSEGWMEYYRPYVHLTDVSLPPLNEGQKVQVKKVTLKDDFTKPLPRYNPRSLLMKMEKEELGTKATRASTIQTLYDRKYLQGRESMVVTELGFEVIEVLRKYCPTVVSSKMTRMLEQKMDQIYHGQVTKEAVVEEAVEILKPVTLELKEKEAVIGASLSQAIQKLRLDERTIGKCPKCQSGKLVILRSKKTGKRFVGCTNYFEHKCDDAYPLPQKGVIKTSGVCKICGCPTIRVFTGIKKPWCLCLKSNCPSKKEKVNREL
jgi:DNA topoisomerase-1